MSEETPLEKAVLGGGCFWCLEAVFEEMEGVRAVVSGYAGGPKPDPTYEEVCGGKTGHAEVIEITFDPTVTNYGRVLERFWKAHDPTTLNRQGADVGEQYRSIILVAGAAQKEAAEASKREAQKGWERPVVTQIVPLGRFYPAEEYHQDYYRRNPGAGYCAMVIRPKLKKLGME